MSDDPNTKRGDGNLVVTPGGPRPKGQTHLVRSGEAVRASEEGKMVIVPDKSASGKTSERVIDMADDMILTPGGFRHKSLVHKVEAGHALHVREGRLHMMNLSTRALIDIPPAAVLPEQVPALGSGWIAYAFWNNGTGQSVSSFRTTWQVPPAPKAKANQTIFLFNGIQNYGMNFGILQPVLQWGPSAAGGGAYWSVASWYVTSGGQAFYTQLVPVNEGDTLTGVMTMSSSSGTLFNYDCEFQGIVNTKLPVQNIAELLWCNETLEAYGIDQCSNYPNTDFTAFGQISVQTGNSSPVLNWTPVNQITDCGQHAVVVSNSSANGEVDIYYRNPIKGNLFFRRLAWAWMILIGYILLTPIGPLCIVCGGPISDFWIRFLGVGTIGVAGTALWLDVLRARTRK